MRIIAQTLESIQIAAPTSAGGLTMYPLLARAACAFDYLLLDDALRSGLAEVTEISESGSVPKLRFRNKAGKDILLVDGEELIGAKQNRILNVSVLVGAGQEVDIPVSCVEAGRWSWRSKRFAASGRKLHARARAEKMRGVSLRMAASGEQADGQIQAAVWRSIDAKMAAFRVESETAALHDVYRAKETLLGAVRDAFRPLPGQVGAAFAVGDRLVGLDLYDSARTLGRLLPKLVDSYAFDAIEEEAALHAKPPALPAVRELLDRVAQAQGREYPGVAKGWEVRIEAAPVHAAALVADDRVAHLAAFES